MAFSSLIGIYSASHHAEMWHKAVLEWGSGTEAQMRDHFQNALSPVGIPQAPDDKASPTEAGESLGDSQLRPKECRS